MSFDIMKAAKGISSGQNLVDVIGTQFGVPSCALNFAKDLLSRLPSPFLVSLNNSIKEGKRKAREVMTGITRKLFLDSGIIELDTRTGRLKFANNVSDAEAGQSMLDALNDLGVIGEAVGFAAEALRIGGALAQQYQDIVDCINQLKNMGSHKRGGAGRRRSAKRHYDLNKGRMENASAFIEKADKVIGDIDDILTDRINGVVGEPKLNGDFIFPSGDFSGVSFKDALRGSGYAFESAASAVPPNKDDIFYITNIPSPVAKTGYFLRDAKGIYYDSTSGGIYLDGLLQDVRSCGLLNNEYKWLLSFNPDCGGKGKQVTLSDFNAFANTILDIDSDNTLIDNENMVAFYQKDAFLQNIENQRNKQVVNIKKVIDSTVDEAIKYNEKRNLLSVIATYDKKINKRKRQILLAVIFGKKRNANGSFSPYVPGEIPVNDFSYLDNSPVSVTFKNQKGIVFTAGEVDGLVLPVVPTFSSEDKVAEKMMLESLLIPMIGKGDIIYTSEVLSGVHVQSLTDTVVTDKLFALYNFLDSDISLPDSGKYLVTNNAGPDAGKNAAQLLGSKQDVVFASGIGIPFLSGICGLFKDEYPAILTDFYASIPDKLYAPSKPKGAVILPNSPEYNGLLYKESGFSFDCWLYMPNLNTWPSDQFHKVLLANENFGSEIVNDVGGMVSIANLDETLNGLMIGFTRDVRITTGAGATNSNSINTWDLGVFYIAPTVGVNSSSIAFMANNNLGNDCLFGVGGGGAVGLTIGKDSFSSVSSDFCHLVITGDPMADNGNGRVSVYLDSVTVESGKTYKEVFGRRGIPNIPSRLGVSSFEYDKLFRDDLPEFPISYIPSSVGWTNFWMWDGPNGNLFTPWVIGGGYTDGFNLAGVDSGNFMGQWGGRSSGLGGNVGSVKFYEKPLNKDEVKNNFDSQKAFFKNIVT